MKSNERRRRKVRRKKFLIKLMLFFIEILILFLVLRQSTLFKVKRIDVVGNERLSRERVIEVLGVSYGENLLRISKSKLESQLRQEPYIDSVKIRKKLLHQLVLEISEKKPVAYFVAENSKILVDGKLNFLEVVDDTQNHFEWMECRGFLQSVPTDDATLKKELIYHIENDFFVHFFSSVLAPKVQRVEAIDRNIIIHFKDGTEVLFGDSFDGVYKINLLSEIFRDLEAKEMRAKRIDMTNKYPVITKVEGEEDESE